MDISGFFKQFLIVLLEHRCSFSGFVLVLLLIVSNGLISCFLLIITIRFGKIIESTFMEEGLSTCITEELKEAVVVKGFVIGVYGNEVAFIIGGKAGVLLYP